MIFCLLCNLFLYHSRLDVMYLKRQIFSYLRLGFMRNLNIYFLISTLFEIYSLVYQNPILQIICLILFGAFFYWHSLSSSDHLSSKFKV